MRGDEDLMREAISNLVDNAIKFTPRAARCGSKPAFSMACRAWRSATPAAAFRQGARADLPAVLSRRERGEVSGHGLGLSIAQTIANLHGFQLTVEDNRPGARFVMRAAAKASLGLARAAE